MTEEINWSSINSKIQTTAFGLFRFWIKKIGISDKIVIKTEKTLVSDLKRTITQAIITLNQKEDLDKKPNGWSIGFIIGFIDGNLGKHWYHEYIVKNSEDYKTYVGLRAIEAFFKFKELDRINIDRLYEELLKEKSNIENQSVTVNQIDLNGNNFIINHNADRGKVLTILKNLIIKQVKTVIKYENKVELPIDKYFTEEELEKLIADNKTPNN